MPRSNNSRSLTGGRALYRGKDAYAAQGFENDTRQSQLPALAVLHLWGNQSIPGGSVETTILFNRSYTSSTFNPIFTRNFFYTDDGYLITQKTGTYFFNFALRGGDVAAGESLRATIEVSRGFDRRLFFYVSPNSSAGVANVTLSAGDYVDLKQGDTIRIFTSNPTAFTVSGGSVAPNAAGTGIDETIRSTYLSLEEVDLT